MKTVVRLIDPHAMTLSLIMKKNVVSIGMDECLKSALEACTDARIRHLPFVDEENMLVGILTDTDLHRCLVELLEEGG